MKEGYIPIYVLRVKFLHNNVERDVVKMEGYIAIGALTMEMLAIKEGLQEAGVIVKSPKI